MQYYVAMYYNHSSMHKVNLVKGHVVYVYWINTVDVQNNPPTPESQLAFHIYINYVKYENTLTCKRISWDLGGGG